MNDNGALLPHAANILTPQTIALVDCIARCGSFAAAARELGKVPSALTYAVRQLEESLDVLLFDRSSRHARLTSAGEELLREGRHIIENVNTVVNKVRRVAGGWESSLTLVVDSIVRLSVLLDLFSAFYALKITPDVSQHQSQKNACGESLTPPTRLYLRTEVLSGPWEVLTEGEADLTIAIEDDRLYRNFHTEPIGSIAMGYYVAPNHPLAHQQAPLDRTQIAKYRAVVIADTARTHTHMTLGIQPGQDILTVPSLSTKLHMQLHGLGSGFLPSTLATPYIKQGLLVEKTVKDPMPGLKLVYAWSRNNKPQRALRWWIDQLRSPQTREALMQLSLPLVA